MKRIPRTDSTPGFTLPELATVLVILAVVVSSALPSLAALRDRMAILQAREILVGAVAWARRSSQGSGGAWVSVVPDSGRIHWGDDVQPRGSRDLKRELGVILETPSRAPFTLRFDDLGLGQVTSRTIVFRRGSAETGVSLSSYGRVRRW
jgi:prepilin-type N-terminal cleavage/methylation domain-containing protein